MTAAEWDARYAAAAGGLFGDRPSEYLRMALARSDVAARSALLLADGDGRNGAWLAAQGLEVTAVDFSAVATARARARDRALGARVAREIADIADWAPPAGRRFDLAAIQFLHGPPALRRRALETAAAALGPRGVLVLEGFARDRRNLGPMGPDDPEKRYDLGETLAALAGLEVIEALEGAAALDEGPRHAGVAAVVRVLARRPA